MKTYKQLLAGLIIILSFTLGCSKDETIAQMMDDPQQQDPTPNEDPDGQEDPDPSAGEFLTTDIQVNLPDGNNLDLSTTKVFSIFEDIDVSASGQASAVYPKDGRALTMLKDSNEETILMGFITDSKKELSISSTLEVSLFFGLGTVFLPEEIKAKYMSEAVNFTGFGNVVTAIETLYAEDINFLGSEAYNTAIEEYINELTADGTGTDASGRLNFSGDTRSGVNLEEKEGNSIILVNSSRRRAHAFFYKTDIKDLNDTPTNLISDIVGTNANFQKEVIVSPSFALTSTIGVFQNQASGKGMEVARKESDPRVLSLADNENEALYKVRLIGPSATPAAVTSIEEERLRELEIETLGFDIALPVLMAMVGQDKFLADFKESQWQIFYKGFELAVGSLPAVSDALREGNMDKAQQEFFDAMSDTAASGIFEDLFKVMLDNLSNIAGGFSQENSQRILGRTASFFKALAVVDKGLQFYDFKRIFHSWASSNSIEEWEVTATRNKISLDPRETLVIQGEEKIFKANIQDSNLAAGQSYEYRWSTAGNYGNLRANGKEDTSLTTSGNQIAYFSSNVVDVPEGALETIKVEVYIKQGQNINKLGEAEAVAEIKPIGFEIEPDRAVIEGNTNLKLRVLRTDGTDPTANSAFDYRMVWYTSAQFGLFNGAQSTIDIENSNSVTYRALELEEEGVEEIEVSIYARPKGTTDRFRFVDKVDATINIENDPLKEIFFIDEPTIVEFPPHVEGIYCNWSVQAFYKFNPLDPAILEAEGKEVVKYQLTIKAASPDAIPSYVGTGQTWEITNGMDLPPEEEYSYRYSTTGGQGGASACGSANSSYDRVVDIYKNFAGYAEVVVTLKYKE
ncbi:MAG: hypothetical protein AB3N14_09540 [Flavobacteriaceae bacterium]